MEKLHGTHKDSKLLEVNNDYVKLVPLGVCKEMREIHADQVRMKVWPVLATKIPQANICESKRLEEDYEPRKNRNGYNCFNRGSEYHLKTSKYWPHNAEDKITSSSKDQG